MFCVSARDGIIFKSVYSANFSSPPVTFFSVYILPLSLPTASTPQEIRFLITLLWTCLGIGVELAWGLIFQHICLGKPFSFAWGAWGVNFGNFFAWGGFAWGCDEGVLYYNISSYLLAGYVGTRYQTFLEIVHHCHSRHDESHSHHYWVHYGTSFIPMNITCHWCGFTSHIIWPYIFWQLLNHLWRNWRHKH